MDAAVNHLDPPADPQANTQAGFSLIEMLVVVAVLAILAVSGTLATGRSREAQTADASRFQALFAQQSDLAIQGRSLRGLYITPTGLQLAKPAKEAGTDPAARSFWQRGAQEIPWRGRVLIQPRLPAPPPGTPDVVFLPDGRHSALSLSFIDPDTGARQGCSANQSGGLTCQNR